jgi:HD-like signal output (HDOD) protein
MSIELSDEVTLKAIRGINIPPQPEILRQAHALIQKDSPDIIAIAHLISRDAALSAAVLKTVNSSFFAPLMRVSSVQHGIALLGLNNVINIVAGVALRGAIESAGFVPTPRYWDEASRVARLCAMIARHLGLGGADEAYTLGLFHDCGIPVMAQRFPNYKAVLAEANVSAERCTLIEDRHFQTNHAVVGYYMTQSWNLTPVIRKAILIHHDLDQAFADDNVYRDKHFKQLVVALKLADWTEHCMRSDTVDYDWERARPYVLDFLGLSEPDAEDLRDLMREKIPATDG